MKAQILRFCFLLLLLLHLSACVRLRKKNKSRRERLNSNNVTSEMQPPELIEIIEMDTITLVPPPTTTANSDVIITTFNDDSKKLIVNEEIKSLIQTLKNVMKKENNITSKNVSTTRKPTTISSYEMKKIHLDAPLSTKNTAMLDKRQLIAKSVTEAPKYIELDCKFGNMSDL